MSFSSFVDRVVDLAARRPWRTLALVILGLALSVVVASRIELHSDLLELLPRDSPGFRAFEHQLGRVTQGASLIVVAESPSRDANEAFADALGQALERAAADRSGCTGNSPCTADLIAYVEAHAKDVLRFQKERGWLYLSRDELEQLDDELSLEVAKEAGIVESFDDEPAKATDGEKAHVETSIDKYEKRAEHALAKLGTFPSGHFETEDGTAIAVRVVSTSSGTGDSRGDALFARVTALVATLDPGHFDPRMKVGYAGDIPNALEEKESVASDAVGGTLLALGLILLGIVVFFRSAWAVVIVALPALVGVGAAYAFAELAYGYVNTTGAFLGAIILGNGINYPIVLLARYREFVATGQAPAEARRRAVRNAFRAELVGALVASIAYGSLTVTRFRGFTQFGTIGFVGMLLVWSASIVLVPTLVALLEHRRQRAPSSTSRLR
ncbi:MAG TPA: MMPL family transporter [Polyangiaceae bacterium]|nr:MMPL family transporter [Polyangiaceae bacterium]